jgi:uroporphyrinogen-III synthase
MIPLILPPLHGLGVLVTRPAQQGDTLLAELAKLGAHAMQWPTLDINALPYDTPGDLPCDLLIFISTNAVTHGASLLTRYPAARIAAVGQATAAALLAQGQQLDAAPEAGSSSEALLAHPLLQTPPPHIIVVRGRGGRELLQETLAARGAQVNVMEVYERTPLQPQPAAIEQLQQALHNDAVDVVTATSVDVLEALRATLPDALRHALQDQALLCGSVRIAHAAQAMGWQGEYIVARSPQQADLLVALCRWHTRQRAISG